MADQSTTAPVHFLDKEDFFETPSIGIALCLSGGGYRAMLFHVGALIRLNEAGLLPDLKRVSSVSGGSITSGVLGMNWRQLEFTNGVSPRNIFFDKVVKPIRQLASQTLDAKSIVSGLLLPGTISDKVAHAYEKHIFANRTLQDLPSDSEGPRFVINATNIQSGSLWRFSRPFMGDWKVALWDNPNITLAKAVAASSAFPPILSPCLLDIDSPPTRPGNDKDTTLFRSPYTQHVVLSDGGVYDNLGLETSFKRYKTILVSDGGLKMPPDPEPHEDWAFQSKRVLDVIDNQVRSLRKRLLINAYVTRERTGAYWGVGSHFEDYSTDDPLNFFNPTSKSKWRDIQMLSTVPTRLAAMEENLQKALINWGYVICDAALRKHVATDAKRDYNLDLNPAAGLPYPEI